MTRSQDKPWTFRCSQACSAKFQAIVEALDARPELKNETLEKAWDEGQWPFVTCFEETTVLWLEEGHEVVKAVLLESQCDGAMDETEHYTIEVQRTHPELWSIVKTD